ncbi:MAG TPA: phosphatase PAP2-related protein [Polyangiales bacterium]|nr:phosphatase PAP2-related protein [Polyangiales bacterium]
MALEMNYRYEDTAPYSMPTEPALSWAEALRSRRFALLALCTFAGLIAALVALNHFLQFNERRPGVTLVDPVLAALPAADLSVPLFVLIYGTLVITLGSLAYKPRALLVALQAYAVLASFRMLMMYTIPLEAPPGMILLIDPIVRAFGDGPNWAKDLFFSGHTSTTFLCALSVRSRSLRLVCFAGCATVAALILVQHAHYTIDVLVAPFVAFASQRIANHFTSRALDGRAQGESDVLTSTT